MVHARKYWLWFSQHFTSIWGQATHIFTLHFLDKGMEKVNIYYGMLSLLSPFQMKNWNVSKKVFKRGEQ